MSGPEGGQTSRLQLHLQMTNFQSTVEARIARAMNRALIAMRALQVLPDSADIRPDLGLPQMVTIGDVPRSSSQSRKDTLTFVLGASLKDAVDGFNVLCEEIWRILLAAEIGKGGPLTASRGVPDISKASLSTILDAIIGPQREFDGYGLQKKMTTLHERFGVECRFRMEVESINKARTCMTHRMGVVADRDLNDPAPALAIHYRGMDLAIRDKDGNVHALKPPMEVEGPASLLLLPSERRCLRFTPGAQVTLDPRQFMETMTTLFFAARDLCGATFKTLIKMGIPDTPRKT